ncbi:hypothetical protein, partial [Escherichia coli]
MGISASGNITIYPDGPVTLSAGQSYVSYDEWGNPAKCGQSEVQWPVQGIRVIFSRPLRRSELPVRILSMGR